MIAFFNNMRDLIWQHIHDLDKELSKLSYEEQNLLGHLLEQRHQCYEQLYQLTNAEMLYCEDKSE